MSQADIAIGRLDGVADIVPNPDLFVEMYVRKEAVLSSRIEGTQASLSDVLEDEAGLGSDSSERRSDVAEVRNYVRAMQRGLERLPKLPLSLRLLKEIHAELLQGVRGKDKSPGEFRRTQNWIGPESGGLQNAAFVPPPVSELPDALSDLERYMRAEDATPVLVRAGVAHAQFETIHPFLDGNGRLGRLLITFMLCERDVLRRPLLYLSAYFNSNKQAYYDALMRVREQGDWEGWLELYLDGVKKVSEQAVLTAQRVLKLQQDDRQRVQELFPRTPNAMRVLDAIYRHPTTTVRLTAKGVGIAIPTANTIISKFCQLRILDEVTGRQRDRVFRHRRYLKLLTPE